MTNNYGAWHFATSLADHEALWSAINTLQVANRVLAGKSRWMTREEAVVYKERAEWFLQAAPSFPGVGEA